MVNTDYLQSDDIDDEAPYRTFGLGLGHGARVTTPPSIRREHR